MKKYYVLALFCLACILSNAQPWGPDTRWIYSQDKFMPDPSSRYLVIRHEKDTVVQGHDCDQFKEIAYSIWGSKVDSFLSRRFILLREVGRVWFYEPDDSTFYKIYDFNLGVGDTLHVYGQIPGISSFIPVRITEVSTIQIGNETRKVQQLQQLEPASFRMEGRVIEEIGWDEYLLPRPGFVDPAPGGGLICYLNGSFQYPESGVCNLLVSTNEPDVRRQVRIAPNPAAGPVRISADPGEIPEEIRVLAPDGRILAVAQGDLIDVSALPPGLYFLHITWPSHRETVAPLIRL